MPPAAALPPAAASAATSPWAPPDQGSGSWGSPPPGSGGPFAVPGAPGLVYAGAIPRAAAWIVDSFLLSIIVSIVTIPFAASAFVGHGLHRRDGARLHAAHGRASGIAALIGVAIEAAYFILLWMSSGRATLGMRLFGLQVGNARRRGEAATRPGGQALARLRLVARGRRRHRPWSGGIVGLVQLAWTLVLLVTTASSPTKQGLHDKFAGSAVVRPATAGNGLAITCLIVALIVPILAIFSLVSLILLGTQVSSILSAVGDSI